MFSYFQAKPKMFRNVYYFPDINHHLAVFCSSFLHSMQLSVVQPEASTHVTFSVLTHPALKCSLFHYAIHESHLGSGSPESRYFWYILSQRLHWEKLLDRIHRMTSSVTDKSVFMPFSFGPSHVFIYGAYCNHWALCDTYQAILNLQIDTVPLLIS